MSRLMDVFESPLPWLGDLALRATVILALAWLATLLLRRASAAARHAVLTLAVAGLLALPVLSLFLPRIELPVLQSTAPPPAPASVRVDAAARRTQSEPVSRRALAPASGVAPAAAPAAPEAPWDERTSAPWSLATVTVGLWLLGVAVGAARITLAGMFVRRLARRAVPAAEDLREELAASASTLGLPRMTRLLVSDAVSVAVVFGYRRSVVLLAPDAAQWPAGRRTAFLTHELAHVQRWDCLVQFLAQAARVIYWPHPLAWWLVARLGAEAERACDDLVLRAGVPPDDYASHLLDAARALTRSRRPLAVLAVVERSRLEGRVLSILDGGRRREPLKPRTLALAAAVSVACLASAAAVEPVAREAAALAEVMKPARPAVIPQAAAAPVATPVASAVPRAAAQPHPSAAAAPKAIESAGVPQAPLPAPGAAAPEPDATVSMARPEPAPDTLPVPAPAPDPAPTPAPLVIRISTSLVQLDAVVTDGRGTQVTDLTPADFEIKESGRSRAVTHLSYVRTAGGAGKAASPPSEGATAPRTLVFLVDSLHLSQKSIRETQKLIAQAARSELTNADRVALADVRDITETGLRFTSDMAAVADAAQALRYNPWNVTGTTEALAIGSVTPFSNRMETDFLASRGSAQSLGALKGIVLALRGVPGRKGVVFLSEGFESAPSSGILASRLQEDTRMPVDDLYGDATLGAAARSVADLANRASVVLYAIAPTGLTTTDALTAAAPTGTSPTDRTWTAPVIAAASGRETRWGGLFDLVEPTGGLVVRDTNNIGGGLGRILEEQAGYYLIGYTPDEGTFEKDKGVARFHKVQVRVKRRGLKIRSRQGFYGVTDEAVAAAAPVPSSY